MLEIIENINSTIEASSISKGVKTYGICKLVTKENQPHPVAIADDKQVAPNDRWEGIIYHRLLNDAITESEEHSFGSRTEKLHNQQIRTVVMIKRIKTENWIDDLINVLPRQINGLTDYRLVNIGAITKNTDQDTIFNTEFGQSGYEKHRMTYLIYALEYSIEYIRCV
jgi:hypothetical protein